MLARLARPTTLLLGITGTTLLTSNNKQDKGAPPQPRRILIVGSGLTGCLTAALLRRKWPENCPPPHLTVWERASYPAGRFGAKASMNGHHVADMGAQVLSIVDEDDEHAHTGKGGHGITLDALACAKNEVQRFISKGLLVLAPDTTLAPTEERMLWEGACYY